MVYSCVCFIFCCFIELLIYLFLFFRPPCSAPQGFCEWQSDINQPLFDITEDYLITPSVAIHKAPVGSGAADRNYFSILSYNITSNPPILINSGIIGDCTSTESSSLITGIIITSNNDIILSGHIYSYSSHFYNLNDYTHSHTISGLNSPISLLIQYSLHEINYKTSFIDTSSNSPSLSYGLHSDPLKSQIWFAFLRPSSSNSSFIEICGNVIDSQNLNKKSSGVIKTLLSSNNDGDQLATSWKESTTLQRILGISVDFSGEILFLITHNNNFQMFNELSKNNYVSITPNSFSSFSYYLSSFTIDGNPSWSTAISLSPDITDSQVGHFNVEKISKINFDSFGKIRIFGSLKQQLPVSWSLQLGFIASLDGINCKNCNNKGWCSLGSSNIYGECICDTSSFGDQCNSSILLSFSNYLNWSQKGVIINNHNDDDDEENNDKFEFYGIHVDTKNDILYVTGIQRGEINYQSFLNKNSKSSSHNSIYLPERNGDGFISSIAPNTGFLYWISYVSLTNNKNSSCYITQVDVEKFNGVIFISGWSEPGILEFYNSKSFTSGSNNNNNNNVDDLFQSFDVPESGSSFVGQLYSNGTWIWAEIIKPRNYCFTSCLPDENHDIFINSDNFWDFYVDLKIYSTRQYGGVELYIGGTYFTNDKKFDCFVRRYNLLNAFSRPNYVWDVTGSSLDHLNSNSGRRGTRSISLLSDGTVIAGGYWTAPSIEITDGIFSYHDLISHWAIDPSIRYRWTMKISETGQVNWLHSNDLPSAAFITQSELYDTSISSNDEELWICIHDVKYTVNSIENPMPNQFYDIQSGSITLSTLTGNDYVNSAITKPLEINQNQNENSQVNEDDILFFSNIIDPLDNIISGGYFKNKGLFSSNSFIPKVTLESKLNSKSAIISSWDRFGNLQYIIQSYYGNSTIHQVYSDNYGNLFISGHADKGSFFDDSFISESTSFLFSFSACKNNCNFNGVCIFGSYGAMGTCSCNTGWTGDYCDIRMCFFSLFILNLINFVVGYCSYLFW